MRRPKRKSDLAFNHLIDQMVIINFNSERQFHQTNEVGALIWELCDGTHSIPQIVESITNDFDVDYQIAESDCLDFISELDKNELLDG